MFKLIKSNLPIDTTFDFLLTSSSIRLAAFEKNSHIVKNSSEIMDLHVIFTIMIGSHVLFTIMISRIVLMIEYIIFKALVSDIV